MKRSSTNDGNHEFSLSIERAQSRTDSFLGEYGSLAADKPKGCPKFSKKDKTITLLGTGTDDLIGYS